MIWPDERKRLWEIYPEVRELFESYNDALLEDDAAWKSLAESCDKIEDQYNSSDVIRALLLDLVRQLEQMARKRSGI